MLFSNCTEIYQNLAHHYNPSISIISLRIYAVALLYPLILLNKKCSLQQRMRCDGVAQYTSERTNLGLIRASISSFSHRVDSLYRTHYISNHLLIDLLRSKMTNITNNFSTCLTMKCFNSKYLLLTTTLEILYLSTYITIYRTFS